MTKLVLVLIAVVAVALAACDRNDTTTEPTAASPEGFGPAAVRPAQAAMPTAASVPQRRPYAPSQPTRTPTAAPQTAPPQRRPYRSSQPGRTPTAAPSSRTPTADGPRPEPTATAQPKAPSQDRTATPTPSPSPTAIAAPDSFIAVVPQTLRKGYSGRVSVSLFDRHRPAAGPVRLSLFRDGTRVRSVAAQVNGTANIEIPLERLEPGAYRVQVAVEGVSGVHNAMIAVEDAVLLLVETDKPIYKPGQTVRIRLMTVDASLKPWPTDVTIVVEDSRGNKVFKSALTTDDYGMATADLPLSTEPNLGVWKLTAYAGHQKTELEIRVEEYVVPRYKVDVETTRGWVLPDDPIRGSVSAEYFFGKPVEGEVEVVASRHANGRWEEYARFTGRIDGETSFELPPVKFVPGLLQPEKRGSVRLDATVYEKGTGHAESTNELLTVSAAPVVLTLITESHVLKPGLEMKYVVVARTPDGSPVDTDVTVRVSYKDAGYLTVHPDAIKVRTAGGIGVIRTAPPQGAIASTLVASADGADAVLVMEAGYSPSGVYIHAEQVSDPGAAVGDTLRFRVNSTEDEGGFTYDVITRGAVVLSGVSRTPGIEFAATETMAPWSRLLVYRTLPNNEIVADYLPFRVEAAYPHDVAITLQQDRVRPGDPVDVRVRTQGASRVGLVAVDTSVFALADNRLNLREVYEELGKLDAPSLAAAYERRLNLTIMTLGARQIFEDAGTIVLTNKHVPSGQQFQGRREQPRRDSIEALSNIPGGYPLPPRRLLPVPAGRVEIPRVRQFFPETWIWQDVYTGADGSAVVTVDAPDTITTWTLRAVGLSKEHGLGIAETSLGVFQPFFLEVDLPFSVVRGEELQVEAALFNYLGSEQHVSVEIEDAGWFDLLDQQSKSITVGANDLGVVAFTIRPTSLGSGQVRISARSAEAGDVVVKDLLVEPEGVETEVVSNHVVSDGFHRTFEHTLPTDVVHGSERAYVMLTGSFLAQPIAGLERLLRMPFGCGEQNMVLFAPNVYVARYLEDIGQLNPQVMARAKELMMVGYQRQLTFQRDDGSFSAFGNRDAQGSLWLTAFVLKTFAAAGDFIYVDTTVSNDAAAWIESHQLDNGAFESVGFVHDRGLLGGASGRDALTAYVAAALLEAGRYGAARAVHYLEGRLDEIDDPYTMALTAYALALAESERAEQALLALASMSEKDGGEDDSRSAAVEAKGYELLALLLNDDLVGASWAAESLVSGRNALGGFRSTQDTVVGLQALAAYSTLVRADSDMTVVLESPGWRKEVRVTPENFDVLQTVQVPIGERVAVAVRGHGTAVLQSVLRYNVPERPAGTARAFHVDVDYGAERVDVGELITVTASIRYAPPVSTDAGMVVLEVGVPTGFEPVRETVAALTEANESVKRFEIADRKVVLYIDDMAPGDGLSFEFQARAEHPVRAKAVVSRVYSYYRPELRGETLAGAMTVTR